MMEQEFLGQIKFVRHNAIGKRSHRPVFWSRRGTGNHYITSPNGMQTAVNIQNAHGVFRTTGCIRAL